MACHISFRLISRVISLIRTGARRFERSFLCTTRKLTSGASRTLFRTRIFMGMAPIKATSFLDCDARTPMCQSFVHPGHMSVLMTMLATYLEPAARAVDRGDAKGCWRDLPLQNGRGVVEPEHGLVILDVVAVEQLVDLLELVGLRQVQRVPFEALDELGCLGGYVLQLLHFYGSLLDASPVMMSFSFSRFCESMADSVLESEPETSLRAASAWASAGVILWSSWS